MTSLSAAYICASASLYCSTMVGSRLVPLHTNGTSFFFTTFFFFGGYASAPSTCIATSSRSSISSVYAPSNDKRPCRFRRVFTFTTE